MEPSILSLLRPVVTIGWAIATRRILLALGDRGRPWRTYVQPVEYPRQRLMIAEVAGADNRRGCHRRGGVHPRIVVPLGGADVLHLHIGRPPGRLQRAMTKVNMLPSAAGPVCARNRRSSSMTHSAVRRAGTSAGQRPSDRISRAKLSTSWTDGCTSSSSADLRVAAFIAATMTDILNRNDMSPHLPLRSVLEPSHNFYAITAISVFAVAYFGPNFGPMRKHERRAVEEGEVVSPYLPWARSVS